MIRESPNIPGISTILLKKSTPNIEIKTIPTPDQIAYTKPIELNSFKHFDRKKKQIAQLKAMTIVGKIFVYPFDSFKEIVPATSKNIANDK